MPQQADLEWFVVLRDIFPASEEVARVPRTIKDCWGHRGEHDEARLRELVAHDETFQTNVWKMMCPGAHSSDGELVSAGGVGGEVAGDHFIVDASGELVHGGGPSYLLSGPVSSCDAFVAPLVGSANCFAQGLSSPGSPPLVACRPSPVPARTLALASCRIAVQESWSGDDSFCPVVLTGGKGKGRAV
ncbi:MAG: hypothetical protein M1838_005982 [Thelocarpon superellum]|nr:MAG: hypothetical protein M1838_005982 [Thelocarpon superellum]